MELNLKCHLNGDDEIIINGIKTVRPILYKNIRYYIIMDNPIGLYKYLINKITGYSSDIFINRIYYKPSDYNSLLVNLATGTKVPKAGKQIWYQIKAFMEPLIKQDILLDYELNK